jgi:hypothetical protein
MFEDVTINLVSSFEAIAHVLNGFYDLGIEDRIVTIDHKRRHIQQSESCLRCKLREVNLPLANLLDEVLKIGSPVEEWYKALIEFRHQALHRHHFIALSTGKGYFLPDDPNLMTPKKRPHLDKRTKRIVVPNYTKKREIKKFTEALYKRVVETIEAIYLLIIKYHKVKPHK